MALFPSYLSHVRSHFGVFRGLGVLAQTRPDPCSVDVAAKLPNSDLNFAVDFWMFRDGETTIKIKISLLRRGALGTERKNHPKTLVFVGNATKIKF